MIILWIIIAAIVVVALWIVGSYNRFVTFKNRTAEAWADIEVQLKRRYDLIPNLVNTVKGYATHEQGTLDAVIKARNTAMQSMAGANPAHAEAGKQIQISLNFSGNFLIQKIKFRQLDDSTMEMSAILQLHFRYFLEI